MRPSLSVFCAVFLDGDLFNPLQAELFSRRAGWITSFPEKPVQSGRRYHPEQKEFVLRILKSMPGVPGNEDGCAFFKNVAYIVENEGSPAFQDIENLIHVEVPVNWNSNTDHHLLGSQREIL